MFEAIIPLRSKSRGLKNKNILLFKKRVNLVNFTIKKLIDIKKIKKIYILTDSEFYKKIIIKNKKIDTKYKRIKKLSTSDSKIDDLIDPRMNTVSSILKHVHKSTIETAYTIMNGEYEVIEAEIIETSELINKELKNSNLPDEVRIGAVLRGEKIIIPRSNFVFLKEDKVVFLAKKDSISVVENIFRISSI